MKYLKLSDGSVVIATVMPKSNYIDKEADRTFTGEGYMKVQESISDDNLLLKKFDSSAESENIKTLDSFTSPGVDSQNKPRWFDWDSGVLMQYTYDSNNQITGEEEVTQ